MTQQLQQHGETISQKWQNKNTDMKTKQKLREKDAKKIRQRREKDKTITQKWDIGPTQILHKHKFNINLYKFYTKFVKILYKTHVLAFASGEKMRVRAFASEV